MSLAYSFKSLAKPTPVSPHTCRKRSHLIAAKDWWKVCFHQNNNLAKLYGGITNYHDSDYAAVTKTTIKSNDSGDSVIDTNSQQSANQTNHEFGKLFPRNMPSIRRSRRKNMLKTVANNTNNENMPLSTVNANSSEPNKSKLCKVNKLLPKTLKTNQKNENLVLEQQSPRTKKESTYAAKSLMITKNSQKLLGNMKLTVLSHDIYVDPTDSKELQAKSPNSQLSSLMSYDLSLSPSQLSCSKTKTQPMSKYFTAEETFHSSGISCNDETPSEASCNSTRNLTFHASHMSLETEEALIEAEVAQLTENLTHDQKIVGSKSCAFLPVNELKCLNTCRNRNALWLHSLSHPTPWPANRESSIHIDDDDLQLSDLEEQLALVHGQRKTSLSCTATYKK